MRHLRCALVLCFLAVSTLAAAPPDSLAGLWKAKRRFGPDARGTLVVQRRGDAYTAELVGQVVAATVANGSVTFTLPNGLGSFRGRLEGQAIDGIWFAPKTATTRTVYTSPVHLRATGANEWRGVVEPIDETFTFYLLLQKRDDRSLSALLRNPERDIGAQLGVDALSIDGNALRLTGKRGEIATGSYDPDTETLTLAFPNRGGTYDFHRDDDDSGFYPRGKTPGRYVYRPPLARDDGWPASTLEAERIDRAAIERFVQFVVDTPIAAPDSPQIDVVLIARHGRLVVEEYFHGEHRDRLHETRSAAKSLTATVIGAAMHAGAPLSLSSPVYKVMNGGEFPPDLEPRKRAMTLEHLLTMSSGYFCDDTNPDAPGNEEVMYDQEREPDFLRYTLAVPMAFEPGERSIYCSSNPNLALGMLARATGESPLTLFDRLVAQPMKIRRWAWMLDPAGNPYGGGGVQLLPRDFMKLGQLMLNGGTWEGRRILDREFVARASSPLYHLRNVVYGYLWWGIDFPYKDRTVHAFYAGGAGGQGVIVIPELDLVVATYAGNYSAARTAIDIQQNYVVRWILPAVREAGDDPKAPVTTPREWKTPYGKSENGSRIAH